MSENKELTKSEKDLIKLQESLSKKFNKKEKTVEFGNFLDKYNIKHNLFYTPMKMNPGSFCHKISSIRSGEFNESEHLLIKEILIELKKDLDSLIEKF